MSRTFKDVGNKNKKVLWGKRPGSTVQIHSWYWEPIPNTKECRKRTARIERQQDKVLCRDGIDELGAYVGINEWYDYDDHWSDSPWCWEYENIDGIASDKSWELTYEFLQGGYKGFSLIRMCKWDGTITINLTSLVKEIKHG